MLIKGVSHQLELITSFLSVYFLSAYRHMRIVRDIQCVLHTHEQEEDFFSAVINEYQLAALYINDFRQ